MTMTQRVWPRGEAVDALAVLVLASEAAATRLRSLLSHEPGWRVAAHEASDDVARACPGEPFDAAVVNWAPSVAQRHPGVCLEVRQRNPGITIVALGQWQPAEGRLKAFEAGIDDYIAWNDTTARELCTRIRVAVLQRHRAKQAQEARVLRCGALEICPDAEQVMLAGRAVELTRHQYRLLLRLVRSRPGAYVSREELCRAAGIESAGGFKNLHNEVWRLRGALKDASSRAGLEVDAGRLICLVRGAGYTLSCQSLENER
ncbi:MAG: response regulator transcription factor [Polyangiales bacterium]